MRTTLNRAAARAALAALSLTASVMAGASAARAESGPLSVSDAWVPAAAASGATVPLYMTVTNTGAADALLRIRCPVANFTDKRVMDVGEGGVSAREVKALPLPVGKTDLKADGAFVQLLQTTQPLAAGDHFDCHLSFKSGTSLDVPVTVRAR